MDLEQFKQLIFQHYKTMYRVALSIVKDVEDAQDITQEAVTRLWEKQEPLSDINNSQAFCVTVIKRLSIDYLRSKSTRQVPIDQQAPIIGDDDIQSRLEVKDNLNKITHIMEQLPENQRRVMQLRCYSDCSMDEIEQITGFSQANIRAMLSRARKRIKELYNF